MRKARRTRRDGRAVLSSLLLPAALACGGPPGGGERQTAAPEHAPPEDRPPLVLISIDTLRSDHLPAYGYRGVETPAIDRLAADGIRFARAYSHTPLTRPSHATLLTGLLPTHHRLRDNQGYTLDAGRFPTLAARLEARGYATGGAVSAYVLRRDSGLAAGFDLYDDAIELTPGIALGGVARPGGETLRRALAWLDGVGGRPFFLFLHLFEPHSPYAPPEPFASRYASPYDGEIATADALVGQLLDALGRRGLYDRAAVVLVSDHGEGLGDHGEAEHGVFLYRETLQVPLLVKLPGGARAATVVEEPVGLVDVAPTLAELAGASGDGFDGRSLLEDAAGASRRVYAETFYPRLHYSWSELTSLIDGHYHYVEAPRPELYDLEADPGERRNLVAQERRLFASLRQALAAYDRSFEPPAAVDAEERAKLAALGYLGRVGAVPGPLPDPKDKIASLELLKTAYAHYRAGEHAAAVDAFRRLLEENPGMVDAWEYLGGSLERLGRQAEAAAAYQRAFAASGGDGRLALSAAVAHLAAGQLDDALALVRHGLASGDEEAVLRRRLARALAGAGRTAEAEEVVEPLVQREDPEGLATLAFIRSTAGDQEGAAAVVERLLTAHPDDAAAHELAGLVALRRGRWKEAAEASRRAVALDASRAASWNQLGVALFRQGEVPGALDAWQRAVEADPTEYDALYNLAVKSLELGRAEAGRRALERFVATAPPALYAADLREARRLLQGLGG